jgi:hypothetical protein
MFNMELVVAGALHGELPEAETQFAKVTLGKEANMNVSFYDIFLLCPEKGGGEGGGKRLLYVSRLSFSPTMQSRTKVVAGCY